MDEAQKALSRVRTRLATLEITLKTRIHTLLSIFPPDSHDHLIVSPSASMNSTYGDQPSLMSTPTSASTVIRRAAQLRSSTSYSILNESRESQVSGAHAQMMSRRSRDASQKPFFIMDDLRKLTETYKSFDTCAEGLGNLLEYESEAYVRAIRKREHYNLLVEKTANAIENRIWELCSEQQTPLPSKHSEELSRWERHNSGDEILPGFIPPLEHINDKCFSAS